MFDFIATFFIGILASFIGATVGSGGLISIPFLIFLGLPPQVAIATNKMGALGLSLGAIPKFWKEKKIVWKMVPLLTFTALIGAFIGTQLLLSINEALLTKLVGLIILLLLPLLFLKKNLGLKNQTRSPIKKSIGLGIYLLIMIFGAFFGGGAGTLLIYTLMIFFGFKIIEANATDMIPWFALSIASFIIFALNGIVNYSLGAVLFFGMLTGGYLGAHTAIKKGDKWIKTLFMILILASSLKLLFF